jgi:hypothetical protein
LRVVAPNRNPTAWTAGDLLTLAARRGRHHNFGLTRNVHDTISFIECIECVRGPGLALAPSAWHACTINGFPIRRYRTCRHIHPPSMFTASGVTSTDMDFPCTEFRARRLRSQRCSNINPVKKIIHHCDFRSGSLASVSPLRRNVCCSAHRGLMSDIVATVVEDRRGN